AGELLLHHRKHKSLEFGVWSLESIRGHEAANAAPSRRTPNSKPETPNSFLLVLLLFRGGLLAVAGLLVLLLELLDPAGGVHELHFTREERVAGTGDFQPVERVLVAVLPLGRLVGLDARAGQKREVGGRVH